MLAGNPMLNATKTELSHSKWVWQKSTQRCGLQPQLPRLCKEPLLLHLQAHVHLRVGHVQNLFPNSLPRQSCMALSVKWAHQSSGDKVTLWTEPSGWLPSSATHRPDVAVSFGPQIDGDIKSSNSSTVLGVHIHPYTLLLDLPLPHFSPRLGNGFNDTAGYSRADRRRETRTAGICF